MKFTIKHQVSLFVFACLLLPRMGMAGSGAVGGVDLNSAYIYHGIVYNNGMVAQPWIDSSTGPFTFGLWANFDIDDYDGSLKKGEFSEVDLTASYDVTFIGIAWTFRYAEYLFPYIEDSGEYPGTRELILNAKRTIYGGLSAAVRLMRDIDRFDDLYARLMLTYDKSITDAFSVSLMGSGAYAGDGVAAGGNSGMNDYDLRFTGNYTYSQAVTLGANVGYVDTLDEDVLPEQSENWYGGLSATRVF